MVRERREVAGETGRISEVEEVKKRNTEIYA